MNIFDILSGASVDDQGTVALKRDEDGASHPISPKQQIYALAPLADEVDFYAEEPDGESTVRPA